MKKISIVVFLILVLLTSSIFKGTANKLSTSTDTGLVDEKQVITSNYLENTILFDSKTKVVITEDGRPLEDMDKDEYDKIISLEEAYLIAVKAREEYIEKYGVDPVKDLEPVTWGDITWPPIEEEDVKAKQTKFKHPKLFGSLLTWLRIKPHTPKSHRSVSVTGDIPHQIDGKLRLYIVFPKNYYKPTNVVWCLLCSLIGAYAFPQYFDSVKKILWSFSTSEWDADDVDFANNLDELLDDFSEDCDYLVTKDNILVLGWVSIINNRCGIANIGGHFALCNALSPYPFQPPAILVRHELSHCFGALDHDILPWPICLMNYFYLAMHYPIWCDGCYKTIKRNIRG